MSLNTAPQIVWGSAPHLRRRSAPDWGSALWLRWGSALQFHWGSAPYLRRRSAPDCGSALWRPLLGTVAEVLGDCLTSSLRGLHRVSRLLVSSLRLCCEPLLRMCRASASAGRHCSVPLAPPCRMHQPPRYSVCSASQRRGTNLRSPAFLRLRSSSGSASSACRRLRQPCSLGRLSVSVQGNLRRPRPCCRRARPFARSTP
jgi:hypothetical protein